MANNDFSSHGSRRAWGVLLLFLCLLLTLSLFSYDWRDVSLLKAPPNSPPCNFIGPVGAWGSFILFVILGLGSFLLPFYCLLLGIMMLFDSGERRMWPKAVWLGVLCLATIGLMKLHGQWFLLSRKLNLPDSMGLYGRLLIDGFLIRWLSTVGAAILLWGLFFGSLLMVVHYRVLWVSLLLVGRLVADGAAWLWHRALTLKSSAPDAEPEEQTPAPLQSVPAPEPESLDRKPRKSLKRTAEPAAGAEEREPAAAPAPRPEPEPLQRIPPKPARPEPPPLQRIPPRPVPPPVPVVEEPPIPVKTPEPVVEEPVLKTEPAQPQPEAPQPQPQPEPPLIRREQKKSPPVLRPLEDDSEAFPHGAPDDTGYVLPPLDLLGELPPTKDRDIASDEATTARIIRETLAEFGIEAEVTHFEKGPTVTRFELRPAPGIRVERFAALSNNIAMAIKATSVRVQAPIPGKGTVGIEVPNATAKKVYLREILEGDAWRAGREKLPLALGKDVGGNDLVADLADMPHLLVAGATGSGKTVCMNSVLCGLLMARRPSELRLLLVDPKIVEFSAYNNLPHLVVPVITDAKKVALGLRWAINEMEKRYKLFAKVGVRDIKAYNSRPVIKQTELFATLPDAPNNQEATPPPTLPYIVVVVDELADLMLADQAAIENNVARLAQLSRAVGIHMILSTQRPSVNVITGTIKANFPARIAFQVAQKVDSRTILDTGGADKLLGRGDMLFLPPGTSKLIRAQGALTTDQDVHSIVNHIRKQGTPSYEMEIHEKLEKSSSASSLDDGEDDEILEQAIQIIRETRRASTSSLQRRLRIGYTRAARIIDILEEKGMVGPPRGSDPREILIDLDGEVPNNPSTEDPENSSDDLG